MYFLFRMAGYNMLIEWNQEQNKIVNLVGDTQKDTLTKTLRKIKMSQCLLDLGLINLQQDQIPPEEQKQLEVSKSRIQPVLDQSGISMKTKRSGNLETPEEKPVSSKRVYITNNSDDNLTKAPQGSLNNISRSTTKQDVTMQHEKATVNLLPQTPTENAYVVQSQQQASHSGHVSSGVPSTVYPVTPLSTSVQSQNIAWRNIPNSIPADYFTAVHPPFGQEPIFTAFSSTVPSDGPPLHPNVSRESGLTSSKPPSFYDKSTLFSSSDGIPMKESQRIARANFLSPTKQFSGTHTSHRSASGEEYWSQFSQETEPHGTTNINLNVPVQRQFVSTSANMDNASHSNFSGSFRSISNMSASAMSTGGAWSSRLGEQQFHLNTRTPTLSQLSSTVPQHAPDQHNLMQAAVWQNTSRQLNNSNQAANFNYRQSQPIIFPKVDTPRNNSGYAATDYAFANALPSNESELRPQRESIQEQLHVSITPPISSSFDVPNIHPHSFGSLSTGVAQHSMYDSNSDVNRVANQVQSHLSFVGQPVAQNFPQTVPRPQPTGTRNSVQALVHQFTRQSSDRAESLSTIYPGVSSTANSALNRCYKHS